MYNIIDVNTGELILQGTWEEIKDYICSVQTVPAKRLYTNYGFTDDNDKNIYVIRK